MFSLRVLEKAGFVSAPDGGFDVQAFVNPSVAVTED
jgi:hypothetical protein